MIQLNLDLGDCDASELQEAQALLSVLLDLRGICSLKQPAEEPAVTAEAPAPAVTAEAPVELDVEGVPWDARIHAGNKAKIQSGVWRKRKGIDPAEYDRVMAELRGTAASATPPAASATPPAAPATPPAAPATPPAAPAPGTSVSPGGVNWPEFMQRLQSAKQAGTYNDGMMQEIMQRNGIAAVPLFANRADLWDSVLAEMML